MKENETNINILEGEITDENGETVGDIDILSGEITDKDGETLAWYSILSGEITDKDGETLGGYSILSGEATDKKGKNIKLYNLLYGKSQHAEKGIVEVDFCFVATAVYGDSNAPQVQTLREFRDRVLMESDIGRLLVDFYYSGAGRKTADFIKNHLPSTIPAIRRGLDFLVEKYSAQRK